MKIVIPIAALLLLGAACSSAAAPGASSVVEQADKATTVQVEAALRYAATAEQTYFAEAMEYTADLATLQQSGFSPSAGVDVRIARADATSFCIDSTSAGQPMHVGTPDLTPTTGACA